MAWLMMVCSLVVVVLLLMESDWCAATHEAWKKAALKSVMASNRIRSALMEMIHMEERELNVKKGCYLVVEREHHPSIRLKFSEFASEHEGNGRKLLDFLARSELNMNGDARAVYMKDVEVREEEIMEADEEVGMYEKLTLVQADDDNILQFVHAWKPERPSPAITFWSLKDQKPCRVAKVLSSPTQMVPIMLPRDPYLKWENGFIELRVEDEEVWKKAALKSVMALHRMTAPLLKLEQRGEKVAMVEGCYLVLEREGHPSIRLSFPVANDGEVEGTALNKWLHEHDRHMNGEDVFTTYMKEEAVTEEEMKAAIDEVCMYDKLSVAREQNTIQVISTWKAASPHKSYNITYWTMHDKRPTKLVATDFTSTKKVRVILLPKYPYIKWGNDFVSFTLI